jgi:hypothetical protein
MEVFETIRATGVIVQNVRVSVEVARCLVFHCQSGSWSRVPQWQTGSYDGQRARSNPIITTPASPHPVKPLSRQSDSAEVSTLYLHIKTRSPMTNYRINQLQRNQTSLLLIGRTWVVASTICAWKFARGVRNTETCCITGPRWTTEIRQYRCPEQHFMYGRNLVDQPYEMVYKSFIYLHRNIHTTKSQIMQPMSTAYVPINPSSRDCPKT